MKTSILVSALVKFFTTFLAITLFMKFIIKKS